VLRVYCTLPSTHSTHSLSIEMDFRRLFLQLNEKAALDKRKRDKKEIGK
jgi:hypothetical protein